MKHCTLFVFVLFIVAGFFSCKKDTDIKYAGNTINGIAFSKDTVYFDTVFAQVGSVTKRMRIYNTTNTAITIDNIRLAGGTSSPFRLNVDGTNGTNFSGVTIPARDSIFVFVEVTINPNNSLNPFVVLDSVYVQVGSSSGKFYLQALGRNAYYHLPNLGNSIGIVAPENQTITWANDKPHVVYKWAAIDSTGTLIIPAGTQVYFLDKASGIWVYHQGTLQVNGTASQPVTFQGGSHDTIYKNDGGQWNRIFINEGSANNYIHHAVIKNGFIGIQCQPLRTFSEPNGLDLQSVVIQNCKQAGILSTAFTTTITNCIVSNCEQAGVIFNGGNNTMTNCNIINLHTADRQNPSLAIQDKSLPIEFNGQYIQLEDIPTTTKIKNTIITGNLENEVVINDITPGNFNTQLDYCFIKAKNEDIQFVQPYLTVNIKNNQDVLFENSIDQNYQLKPNSPAIDWADASVSPPTDLRNMPRITPDCGALEKQ